MIEHEFTLASAQNGQASGKIRVRHGAAKPAVRAIVRAGHAASDRRAGATVQAIVRSRPDLEVYPGTGRVETDTNLMETRFAPPKPGAHNWLITGKIESGQNPQTALRPPLALLLRLFQTVSSVERRRVYPVKTLLRVEADTVVVECLHNGSDKGC